MGSLFIKDKIWIQFSIIFILVLIVFFKSLSFEFSWLDNAQIEEESCIIQSQQELEDLLFQPLLNPKGQGNYYRPLFKISYTLDFLLYGKNPLGFRITNILLHIFNLILLYVILLKFKIAKEISLLSTLLYGFLPLNTSAVVCLGARADLLAAFFVLFAFLSYLTFQEKGKAVYFICSLLGYILALMSKEIAFPFFLVIFIIAKAKNQFKICNIWYLLLASGYLFIRFKIFGYIGSSLSLLRGEPFITILSSFAGFFRYLFKFFMPFNLSLSDAFPKYSSIFNFEVIFGLILFFMIALFFIRSVRRENLTLSLFLGWLLFFYIPISNIVPALHFWAERFFYLPGIGLIGVVGYLISKRKSLKIPLVAVVLFYGLFNLKYQEYFKNNELLFRRAIDISTKSEEAYNMLGYHHLLNNDYFRTIYYYHLATQDFSGYYTYSSLDETCNNLGVVFLRLKQYKEARKWFQSAVALDGDDSKAVLNLKILDFIESADVK
ncbi:MAG: tetratricopeptide repeat protein [Candidatus Kaelpia imicola]|nr:tetratricopeptide repeat protein [Candidatus Kaelpia imicola]